MHDLLMLLFFVGVFVILVPFLGSYMANVFMGEKTFLHPVLGRVERFCYSFSGVNPEEEMSWVRYGVNLFWFNILGFLALFLIQLLQYYLPLNPQQFPAPSPPLAFSTAISFVTNADWQAYSGENTLSYLSQMLGLTVQNFLSPATGLATLLALIRGLTRKSIETLGNFWVDLVRGTVYLLLPLAIILALILVHQGVVQTFSPYVEITTLEANKQTIPLGPAASQISIKQLGTNGGGFFGANSAHPFENPTPLSNFLEVLAIILIPAAIVYMYGILIRDMKHAFILFSVMLVFLLGGIFLSLYSESMHNPILKAYPLMEGKETRIGIGNSLIWSTATTDTGNGSYNCMLSSLSPLAGGVAMFNMMLAELIFGGIGVGLTSMLIFVLLTVFLCGLMVGRTPEYLGKKIEKSEMQWVVIALLVPVALILIGSGVSSILPIALSSLGNEGPHGLSEILYAFTSCAANNGSSFASLNANTDYYNLTLGIVMFLGRFTIIAASLAIGGLLGKKIPSPPSLGTFSTNSVLFFALLIGVIIIEGALVFFPALSLGPIVEHLLMLEGKTF